MRLAGKDGSGLNQKKERLASSRRKSSVFNFDYTIAHIEYLMKVKPRRRGCASLSGALMSPDLSKKELTHLFYMLKKQIADSKNSNPVYF